MHDCVGRSRSPPASYPAHGGFEGQASDIEITAKQILKLRHRLNEIFAKNTGQKLAQVEKDMDRDFFMSAEEAKKYGIIDKVL